MTVKETIIEALQQVGYDTITACELAQQKIKELDNEKPGQYKFMAGNKVIIVDKK